VYPDFYMSATDLGRRLALAGVVACVAAAHPSGDVRLTRGDADNLVRKLVQITENSGTTRTKADRSTTITEPEVNSYLRYHAASEIPTGVTDPYVTIVGDGRLEGRATVDLDAVRQQKRRGWSDPLGYVSGKLPIQATGRLTTENGIGRFTLDSATISGVAVPKIVLQEVVSYYTRRPDKPSGVSLDDPFELPARIREIKVAAGQAVVVQ
jgi:hypothetical protein